jgi:uncharacterized repeat protein (TIGR03803 family)
MGQPRGIVLDKLGSIYGVTSTSEDRGVACRWQPRGGLVVLHKFGGQSGERVWAPPVLGSDGALYGTTIFGGTAWTGVLYRLTPTGQYTVAHSFTGGADGSYPATGLVPGAGGYLYGTTGGGGAYGHGVVFRFHP